MLKMDFDGRSLRVDFSAPGSMQYQSAVKLARDIYRSAYQADIHPSPDCFLGCSDASDGELLACAGLSFADNGYLFSEQYLDVDLRDALISIFDYDVSRAKVVEVSSLATSVPQLGSEMVRIIPIACWYLGMQAILCTATQRLMKVFNHQKLPFVTIANPEPLKLKVSNNSDWGTYYDTDPKTGVIRLDRIGHLFQSHCGKYDLYAGPQSKENFELVQA